jgi:hemoglobin
MRTRLTWAAVVLTGAILVSPAGARQEGETKPTAGDTKAVDKQVFDALRDVINTGRDLFNKYGDYSGCYRVFQGSLLTVKPLLTHRPDLQKVIEKGMADAEQFSYAHQRAFALRKVLDTVRAGLRSGAAVAAVPEQIGLPKPKVEKIEKAEKAEKTEKTEWERLGGVENVRRIIDDVAAAVAKDPRVNATRGGKYKFTDKQVADMKKKLVELVSEITGGPLQYTGKTMKDVHEGMGITDAEFNAFLEDLVAALKKNNVGQAEIDSLTKKVEGTRPDIVEKQKGEEKKPAETASVSGKVLFQGQPLPGGKVAFHQEKKAFAAKIQPDGTYELKDLPAGSYRVTFQTAPAKNDQPPAVVLPAQYADPQRTPLVVEIQAGKSVRDFELK